MRTKTVYPYGEDGTPLPPILLDSSDLDPVALADDREVWLIPGGCLEVEAPEPPTGMKVLAVDGEWVLVSLPSDPPEPDPEPITADSLLKAATAARWEFETGGITLPSGIQLDTGRDDQNAITRIVANAEAANITEVDFKAASGWELLTIDQVRELACAVARHVQACYTRESALHAAIDAAGDDPEALAAIDVMAGWPAASTALMRSPV